ncbi:MAG TPA: maltose alpha-D-glucosyltransferase [Longimicrobium sp.]|uniref:maltose alpha-D-glucosyltransferase n=1 Tax=Longimicrobium sp. TaxID=2029185 RepID=UPI002EDAE9D6
MSADTLWYKDAVFYELHVKAFQDSSQDGVGDFGGLIQRLDYVAGLGVDVIWLLPFYPSPLRDDGYDIADYYGIHPNYGTLDQVQQFLDEAHKRGLKVIADLVLNHTSSDHPWFQRARRAPKGSPERNFYVWSDDDTLYKDARIIFTDTEPSNWTWDPVAQQYYWHRFFSHQPDLNWDNPEVKETMFRVMEYWLERGLDGFRADAVPYLIEREGTICENLPETHDILKEFRVRLESKYPGRVLLAEANQWPEDVRPYFGDSDEFQMAFHFPLMPRIFMAVRQGIRKPIVEIIERTPAIPDDCQWCMFLRNHDELTLEMVTDEERDYMYREYAADPRMRINLGIRRRLAPLMDNDRRKIELLNSILFTMPGSPIIYYGDEIGMGDNVWLGDRDGVRTPMQWSPDRNAGFSRADAERLYLPVISDAVYGYQAVNVEAQERSPYSLLNWTKRLVRVRKQHRAFGRGSITFLQPENPHVLAYLREYQGDVILVVNNLSASAQAVQLDLAAYAGYTPIELLGETAFLPVDETPYAITLSPYGFFWFALRQVRASGEEDFWQMPEEWARQEAELVADPQAVAEVFSALPREWMPRQRWFRDKSRELVEICLHDHGVLQAERAPNVVLAVLEVRFTEGGTDLYLLPATFHPVAAPGTGPEPLVTHATLRGEARVYEALGDRRVAGALMQAIIGGQRIEGRTGAFAGHTTGAVELAEAPRGPVRMIGAEQSNTSIVFDERLVMKIFRKLEGGINPDLEVTRFLVERAGFRSVPALAGWLDYTPNEGEPHAVAGVFEFVPNGGDAWSVALKALDRYLSAASRSAADPDTPTGREAVRRMAGEFFPAIERLGETTARMHLALASVDDDPAFAPEIITEDDVQRAIEGFRKQVDTVLTDLGRQLEAIPGAFGASVQGPLAEVVRAAPDLRHRAEDLRALTGETARIRIHGDYHLGQVLRANQNAPGGSEWYVLDFEGEPAKPLADRRGKQTVLRDVAGMLRSFNYAVRMAMHEYRSGDLRMQMSLERWAHAWETEARTLFLNAYVRTAQGSNIIPRDPDVLARALAVFELEKAVYEMGYEMNNRPDWLWVPVEGIRAILGGRA